MTPDPPSPASGLFAETVEVVRGIAPVLFVGSGVIALSTVLSTVPILGAVSPVVATIALGVVAYAACLHVLTDGAVKGTDALMRVRSDSGVLFIMAWAFPNILMLLVDTIMSKMLGPSASGRDMLSFFMLIESLAVLFVLVRYGTIYPAIVAGGDPSLAAAGRRGRVGPVIWRMLAISFVGILLLLPLIFIFSIAGAVIMPSAPVLAVFAVLVVYLCMMFVVLATIVVLCNAYGGAYDDPAT